MSTPAPLATPLLSRAAADRDAARRGDAGALATLWAQRGRVLTLSPTPGIGYRTGLDGATALHLPAATGDWDPGSCYLGCDADGAYFSVVGPLREGPGGFADLRSVGALLDARDAGLLTQAVALANWHTGHRFCPRCGAETEVVPGGATRRCPVDASQHFPRTDPAVIVLVTDPDATSAVLGRQASWPPGRYSCLAGFVEAGESAEAALVRELAEEAGLSGVGQLRPMATQPWPFPASLMLAYRAVAPRGELSPLDAELVDVAWFSREQVRSGIADQTLILPPVVSVARRLIDGWLGEDGGEVPDSDPGSWRPS